MVWTAAAGPISNIVLATTIIIGYGLAIRMGVQMSYLVQGWLRLAIVLNFMLAFFNLLPVPPLDGGRIADGLMPHRYRPMWIKFSRVAPFALMAIIFLPMLTGWPSLLSGPVAKIRELMYVMLEVVAGHPV